MFRYHGTKCKISQITREASGILQGVHWLSATWPRNIAKSHLFMKFGSGTSPVLWGNLGPSLRNMVPEHPSDLDPCSHLLASVFIADLEKAARGKMRPIFSGQFSWRTTNSNLAKPRSCFRHCLAVSKAFMLVLGGTSMNCFKRKAKAVQRRLVPYG